MALEIDHVRDQHIALNIAHDCKAADCRRAKRQLPLRRQKLRRHQSKM